MPLPPSVFVSWRFLLDRCVAGRGVHGGRVVSIEKRASVCARGSRRVGGPGVGVRGRVGVGWLGVTLGRPLCGAQMRVLRKPICELAENV